MYIMKFLRTVVFTKIEAYEGIPQLLDFLKEHGILATVLSNKPHQRALENVAMYLEIIHLTRYTEREKH